MDNKDQAFYKQCQVNIYKFLGLTRLTTHNAIQCDDTLFDIHKEN